MSHSSSKILVTGGSGFLGSAISKQLVDVGYEVVSLDINPPHIKGVDYIHCNLATDTIEPVWFDSVFAVINLAGAPIFGRWTREKQKQIYDSRVIGTNKLVQIVKDTTVKNFVSASAVGVYGDRGDVLLTTESKLGDPDKSFLTKVSVDWENAAKKLNTVCAVTIIRNGHILGEGGLVAVLQPYYKWGIGGPLGNGKQWFPWIHIDDCARLYTQAATNKGVDTNVQIYNAVAGDPIQNKTFSKAFAVVLHRPHLFFIPKFALKLLYGAFADEMMYSQKIDSSNKNKVIFNTITTALKNILRKK